MTTSHETTTHETTTHDTDLDPIEHIEPGSVSATGHAIEVDRRRFLTFLVAAPTLAVAAEIGIQSGNPGVAGAVIPSLPAPADIMDLGDALILACAPTANLIVVTVARTAESASPCTAPRSASGSPLRSRC